MSLHITDSHSWPKNHSQKKLKIQNWGAGGNKRRQVLNLGKCQLPVQTSWNSCRINYTLDQVTGVSLGRECHGKGLFLFWESSIVFLGGKKDILEAVVWLGWEGKHCKGWIWSNGDIPVFRGWVVKIKKKEQKRNWVKFIWGYFHKFVPKLGKGRKVMNMLITQKADAH